MLPAPGVMQILLYACMLGMIVLAALFLRGRNLSAWSYVVWGMLAIFVPLLGPFLIIVLRPGEGRI